VSGEAESGFLGLVVHELRSPVAVIVGLAETLETRRHDLTEEQVDESLRRIHAQGGQLAHLVDDLLDLAQVEAGRFRVILESVQLARACRSALEAAPPPADRSVELAVVEDLWVAADPGRLEQVLVNLLTNAYRYGGRRVQVQATRSSGKVLLSVSDDGGGVPVELTERLFDKFSRQTSDGHGAGLGLAIVRGLVEAFGGRVRYEAGQPAGARFVLSLNEAEANLDNPPAGSDLQRWIESVSKILVVDDESNMRFLLRMVFETEGFEVVEAHHGAIALERVKEERPDLVVTDLMMPVMNGRDLVERLRDDPETADIPIVVISSSRNIEVAGADAALRKPFDLDALLEAARSLSRKDAA
jgi:CheY-like chemotaxis protein